MTNQTDDPIHPGRRWIIAAGSASLLAMLSGCQSVLSLDTAEGRSAATKDILAGIRQSNGLSPLTPDARLERAARQQADYMARSGRMAHRTGMGRDFATRMKANGIRGTSAENIAHGRWDTSGLMQVWLGSPAHRDNMLDPRFTRFGLANAAGGDGGRHYWAMVLAG